MKNLIAFGTFIYVIYVLYVSYKVMHGPAMVPRNSEAQWVFQTAVWAFFFAVFSLMFTRFTDLVRKRRMN